LKEHRNSKGHLIATESTKPGERDMIARWAMFGGSGPVYKEDEELVPVPFSLVCTECEFDVAPSIISRAEAEKAGWRDVVFTPEAASCNYQGTCPFCVAIEAGKVVPQ
jgi:hypothetical protein